MSPLTATVLADADEHDAGIASAVNNAIARTAGLLATAAVGAVLAGFYADRLDSELAGRTLTPAAQEQVAAARDRALSPVDPAALPAADRAVVTAAVQRRGRRDVPPRRADRRLRCSPFAGLLGGLLLRNPRRQTRGERCPGGQFVGAPEEAGRERRGRARAA